jgi:imidazolonepropionase-like amidohydrolase
MRALACFLLLVCSVAPIDAAAIVIRNVTVHPVTRPDIQKGAVVISDGKISAVGADVEAPPDAQVIDGQGLHLYPGLINAATNVGLAEIESLRDTVDLDEIGPFTPELRAEIAFNPSSEHIPVTRAAGITSVISLPGSGERQTRAGEASIISGQAALMHLEGWTWEQMAIRRSALMDVLFPEIQEMPPQLAAFLGEQGRSYSDLEKELKKQIRDLHEFFDQARAYRQARAAKPAGFKTDIRLEAMIPVLEGKQPIFMRVGREKTIKAAVEFADAEKVKIILAGPIEIGSNGPLLKAHNIPVVLGPVFTLPAHDDDAYDQPYTLPTEFYKAGVKICFGTFDTQFARNVGFQAAQAAAFGLPPAEALKAVTINSAEILGVADQIGSIENGKLADLILTDGDPLEARTNIKRMFIAGREVSLESRHTREFEKWSARP